MLWGKKGAQVNWNTRTEIPAFLWVDEKNFFSLFASKCQLAFVFVASINFLLTVISSHLTWTCNKQTIYSFRVGKWKWMQRINFFCCFWYVPWPYAQGTKIFLIYDEGEGCIFKVEMHSNFRSSNSLLSNSNRTDLLNVELESNRTPPLESKIRDLQKNLARIWEKLLIWQFSR